MREILRRETQELHRALDSMVGQANPFANRLTYSNYLQRMRQLYIAYQTPLDSASRFFGMSTHAQTTIDCLKHDIDWLTRHAENLASNTTKVAPSTHTDRSYSQYESRSVGIAYTLEGSAIGASFIHRIVRGNPDLNGGMAFLSKLSRDARGRWPVYRAHLETYHGDTAASVDGACDVFTTALKLFCNSPDMSNER